MAETRSATGLAIKFARERAELTQQQLAQRARVAKSHVSRIESGLADPSTTTLRKLAVDGLGMSLSQLAAEIEAERRRIAGGSPP